MTDMTESTELLAFKRQKDGYKVTVKIFLCICVVLSWDELKVWQNLLDSDYEIYMMRLLVATLNWHKSLQFAKKSNISTLTLFISCFDDHVNYATPHSSQIWVPVYISSLSHISCVTSVTQKYKDESTSEVPRDGFFFLFARHLEEPCRNYCIQKTKMSRSIDDSFAGWSQSNIGYNSQFDWQVHTDLANWSVL